MKKVGFVINPVAGIGGKVGLKGSDGSELYHKAIAMGAEPEVANKAALALQALRPLRNEIEIVTYSKAMGEDAARMCGFTPRILGGSRAAGSTAEDTQDAVRHMCEQGTDLILFAGGDGTARDVYLQAQDKQVVIGIPAGVKMHSAIFAVNPKAAGELAAAYVSGKVTRAKEMEVMDLDEEEYRRGRPSAKLYGYMKVPFHEVLIQGVKCSSQHYGPAELKSIALCVLDRMDDLHHYLVGPGTTTRAIMEQLALPKTLLGVDILYQKKIVAQDVNEQQILQFLNQKPAKIVVSPIGGQGYIFGRGNQQMSAAVINRVGFDNITVIATKDKLSGLYRHALFADTGDSGTNESLKRYYRVITGYEEETVCRCLIGE